MELSTTSYVLLGALSMGQKSGYDIKSLLDQSARFFWASSYGQIYPDLKRLAEADLIEVAECPPDARGRIEYRITDSGREALRDWLREPPQTFELRDEGLLKLFFAGGADSADAIRVVQAMRERRVEMEDRLRELEPHAEALAGENPYPLFVLRAGLAFAEMFVEWCDRTERELEEIDV